MKQILHKYIVLITIFQLWALFPVTLQASDFIDFNMWSKGPGQLYQNRLAVTDIEKTPSWSPEEGAPPLTLKRAVEIARDHIKKKNPEFIDYVITEIKLEQFVFPKYMKNKWCYIIICMRMPDGCKIPESMNVLVTMDGIVNEPEVLKY
ncbi:hypothetical protein [Geomonas oryzae]|uniref:hypothetical protein n=1 Tax=Geomonas oryzae TaxID=2364273 RepID=UPI00100AF13F|nr:hypothetical protein [Geomonas oryzae]